MTVEWDDGHIEYACRNCGIEASHHQDSEEANTRLCGDCHPLPELPTSQSAGWPESIAFCCRTCKEYAIELAGSAAADARECYQCHRIPDLDQAPDDSADLPPSPPHTDPPSTAPAEDPEAVPPEWGADPEAEGPPPRGGGRSREPAGQHDRSATQRTRPGTARSAARPVSRTVARRDSVEPDGGRRD